MVLAIVTKELRELRLFAALALAVYGVCLSKLTGHWHKLLAELLGWIPGLGGGLPDVPFVEGAFSLIFSFVGFSLALALGFRQSWGELKQGTVPFLFVRPMFRQSIILTKLLSGAGLLLACTLLPILIYGVWASFPITHAGPFEWSMTAPVVRLWLVMPLIYLGAFASGIRPARWYGSRLFPLLAVVLPAVVLQSRILPTWIVLPALLLLTAVMISNIQLECATRDF
jgi:ABC-2 family transporter protein